MADFPITKTIADNSTGLLNQGTRSLLQLLDPQNKNIFDFILIPNSVFSLNTLKTGAADVLTMKTYLQSINLTLPSFEYEKLNDVKSIKMIEYSDSITFNLLETQAGIIRTYLSNWWDEVYDNETKRFRDNQTGAMKNGFLIPNSKLSAPTAVWFEIKGIQLKSIGEFGFAQNEGSPMIIPVTCKVDNIVFKDLI